MKTINRSTRIHGQRFGLMAVLALLSRSLITLRGSQAFGIRQRSSSIARIALSLIDVAFLLVSKNPNLACTEPDEEGHYHATVS